MHVEGYIFPFAMAGKAGHWTAVKTQIQNLVVFFSTHDQFFYQPLNTSTPTVETFQLLHKSKRAKINEKGKLVPSPLVLACPIRKASMEECKRVEFCNCTAKGAFLSVAVIRKYG